MARINSRSLLLIGSLTALVAVYAALWGFMVANPVELTKKDFIAFYSAGRIANSGNWKDVYEPSAQIAQEEKILDTYILPNNLNPFNHPPFILPILALVANFEYIPAYLAWQVILFLFSFFSAWAILRAVPHLKNRKSIFIGILLFFPIFISILSGQDSTLLLLGISLWAYGLLSGKDHIAGIGLALVTIRPHFALPLALLFLFQRRKVFRWFLVGTLVLGIISFALIGLDGTLGFLRMLGISASGEGYQTNETAMLNFLGLIKRWLPGIPSDVTRLGGWIVYALIAVFLCIWWKRSTRIEEKQIGLTVLLVIFAAPHFHYHDLVLFLIPIICLMSYLKKAELLSDPILSLFPLAISWILLLSNFLDILKYNVPYLVGLGLGLGLWFVGIQLKDRHIREG